MQYRLEGNIFRAKQLYSLGFHLLCRCHLLVLAGGYSRAVLGFLRVFLGCSYTIRYALVR